MISSSFKESTHCLGRPPNMSDNDCDPLCVANIVSNDLPVILSCWKLTKDELEEFNRTGRIWLGVCGQSMPPVFLTANNPLGDQND